MKAPVRAANKKIDPTIVVNEPYSRAGWIRTFAVNVAWSGQPLNGGIERFFGRARRKMLRGIGAEVGMPVRNTPRSNKKKWWTTACASLAVAQFCGSADASQLTFVGQAIAIVGSLSR